MVVNDLATTGKYRRVDLHVHSKYSCRPSEWILRRIGAPESFVEPTDIYRLAKANGMDFVTISDHNCIDGALAISHYPDTFLSTELTTYFPENGCKIHCLVSGITESQFADLQTLRENIYDLREYVQRHDIVHTIAHPLFAINDRLTAELVEKLLVMFNRFEAINGTRYPRANDLLAVICRHLTPEFMSDLADKHGIEPCGAAPWTKSLTGGSDDHSGLYIASAYTQTPAADSVEEFIGHLRAGRHDKGGESGSSLKLAHSLYLIAYGYYKQRFLDNDISGKPNLLGALLQKLIESPKERQAGHGSLKRFATRIIRPWKVRKLGEVERTLVHEFTTLFDTRTLESLARGEQALDQRSFQMACRISQELGCRFLKRFVDRVQAGSMIESLQTLSSLGPVAFSIAPYLTAFRTQHKDEAFLQELAARFDDARHLITRSRRKAWITDSLDLATELGQTIGTLAEHARRDHRELTVITCLDDAPAIDAFDHYNFTPVDVFELPDLPALDLPFPPFLEVVEYLERNHISEIVVSTPGPLGLNALMAAKLLGLKTVGLYPVDFRGFIRRKTEDDDIAQLAWKYLCWFYGQMDAVFVQNAKLAQQFRESGCDSSRIHILPTGIDPATFTPKRRNPDCWKRIGCNGNFKFASFANPEKPQDADSVVQAFQRLRNSGCAADLIFVPHPRSGNFANFAKRMQHVDGVYVAPRLDGFRLAEILASSDVLLAPPQGFDLGSRSVLEAQACGLPMITDDSLAAESGLTDDQGAVTVDFSDESAVETAMRKVFDNPRYRSELAARALAATAQHDWNHVAHRLWPE